MNWIDEVIRDFGKSMGIPTLSQNELGRLDLATDDGSGIGMMSVDANFQTEVVVYRSIPANYLSGAQLHKALSLTNLRKPNPWPVQAGWDGKQLIMAARIPQRAFMASSLEKALEDLGAMLEIIKT